VGTSQRVWRSSARLADGREILYFDESSGQDRADVADKRDLRPAATPDADSELRLDPLRGEWVMYAAQRQDRTYRPATADCPLCPSRPGHLTEIPAADYDVVVFQNRFPALFGPAGGRCEVLCFTSDHDASFASLTERRVETIFHAWVDRTRELSAVPGVRHVFPFENRGEEIGVTLHHPHGQVYAFPFVPPRTSQLLGLAHAHRARSGRNLSDDVLQSEISDGRRIVVASEHWTAFVPQAARWPFEVMIFPATRVADLPATSDQARAAFAPICLDVLRRLDALFGQPMPYIAAWQQAPVGDAADPADRAEFGLHLHLMGLRRAPGKLKYLAGTESGAGAWSNDLLPEVAAGMLRDALPPGNLAAGGMREPGAADGPR
jgi:UDPglucose--hexose-1-phosphate uridylyltransferase